MRRALFAGLLGVLTGAGLLVVQHASAYNGTSCAGATIVPSQGPTPPVTNPVDNSVIVPSQTTGSIHGPGGNEIVCADNWAGVTGGAFDGGAIIAGVTVNNGPTRYCISSVDQVSSTQPVGAYLVADGDNANNEPPIITSTPASDGYIGVSNYETDSGNQNCSMSGGGSGSNSGGSFGVDGLPATQVPLPIACGNTSGEDFGDTERDGCFNP